MKHLKEIAWHVFPIALGLALCACSNNTPTPKGIIICGQDHSMMYRDQWQTNKLLVSNQTCSINQDGSFTVSDFRNEN